MAILKPTIPSTTEYPKPDLTFGALLAVRNERVAQDNKWGKQRHDWPLWITILGEEYGEACQAALHCSYPPANTTLSSRELLDQLRTELVQLSAVAVAIIEHIDEITAPTPARSHEAGTPGEGETK